MILFDNKGVENTEKVLELVKEKAIESNINTIVLPSSRGFTIEKAIEILEGFNIVVVTLAAGYPKQFPKDLQEKYEKKGVKFVKAAHAFGSIGRGVRNKFETYQVDEIIASTLRLFGSGVKVAIEVSLMASDAGYLENIDEVIALGGYNDGVDSAIVLKPSYSHKFFETKVKEILCKPQ